MRNLRLVSLASRRIRVSRCEIAFFFSDLVAFSAHAVTNQNLRPPLLVAVLLSRRIVSVGFTAASSNRSSALGLQPKIVVCPRFPAQQAR